MKRKLSVISYILFIIAIPAITAHLAKPLHLDTALWARITDGVMAAFALIGLITVTVQKPKNSVRWMMLGGLVLLVLIPQLYLWQFQHRGMAGLRAVYRFALIYITLFVIPTDVHFSEKEICLLIGILCLFGVFCCLYAVWAEPAFFEAVIQPKKALKSFFENPNRFGAYTALWTVLCLFALQISGKKIWLLPLAFFAFFLFMTRSRASWMLCGVYMFCCLISYRKRIGMKNLLMILMDIVIVLVILWIIPPVRKFLITVLELESGVSGRDSIWKVSWEYYLESNPLFGHGLGVSIEKIMAERLRKVVSTHNVYLYILNSGGLLLVLFYVFSIITLFRNQHNHTCRKHYLIPLWIAVAAYGFFELACAPFDYWHLSNMFTVCLFTIPSLYRISDHYRHGRKHTYP